MDDIIQVVAEHRDIAFNVIKSTIGKLFAINTDIPNTKDVLSISRDRQNSCVTINYNERSEEEDIESYHKYSFEHFPIHMLDDAINVYIDRLLSENPKHVSDKGYKIEDISIYTSGVVFYDTHYNYLNKMLEYFWLEVFGKTASEMWCGGIVTSHGDKCYGYFSDWAKHGINHNRGSLLFLLSYTKEFGDNDKCKIDEWVINNYNKYLPAIEKAEALVLANIFNK